MEARKGMPVTTYAMWQPATLVHFRLLSVPRLRVADTEANLCTPALTRHMATTTISMPKESCKLQFLRRIGSPYCASALRTRVALT
jgi:hypothetical protein